MRRVSVVGVSGSGKTTLARQVAERLAVPHVELDALYHEPGWTPAPDERFRARVDTATASGGWVVYGNYSTVRPLVWARADTVVWIDPSRWRATRQVAGRTLRRAVTRQELWNGNREPVTGIFHWDPERSVVRWSWTTYADRRDRYRQAMADAEGGPLRFVRLASRRDVTSFLAGVGPEREPGR